MKKETADMLDACDNDEKREIVEVLTIEMFEKQRHLENFYKGVNDQVFGMMQTKVKSGFTKLGMKQLEYLKELIDNLKY